MWGCAENNDTKQGKVNSILRWNIMVKSKIVKTGQLYRGLQRVNQDKWLMSTMWYWRNMLCSLDPPYPYAFLQLDNRWSVSGEIQCEAQLLDERFTFSKNET